MQHIRRPVFRVVNDLQLSGKPGLLQCRFNFLSAKAQHQCNALHSRLQHTAHTPLNHRTSLHMHERLKAAHAAGKTGCQNQSLQMHILTLRF